MLCHSYCVYQRPTLLLQQSGSVLTTNAVGAVLTGVDEPVYTLQPQPSILNAGVSAVTTAPSQILFSFADPTECVVAEETDEQGQQTISSHSDVLLDSQTEVVPTVSDLVNETEVTVEAVGVSKTAVPDVVISATPGDMHYSSQPDYTPNAIEPNQVETEPQLDVASTVGPTEPA